MFFEFIYLNWRIILYNIVMVLAIDQHALAIGIPSILSLLSLQYRGFSLQWLLLFHSTGSRHAGFSLCGAQA